jgi:two-component system, sensor histidine kinase and response regulator
MSYDVRLVALSIAIAIVASYAALDLAGRVTAAQGRSRHLWLLGGAFAMGTGIWSMHYVGMLAFRLPFPVLYDIPTVLASLLLAVCASAVALFVVSGATLSLGRAAAGSVAMGMAIAAMHYTGMAAMRMPAAVRYDPALFTLSVALAIAVSLVALVLAFRLRTGGTGAWGWLKLGSALLMGAAIPAMHYTGMAAAQFSPASGPMNLGYALSTSSLGLSAVVGSSFLVLSLAIGTSILDRRLAGNAVALSRFAAIVESSHDAIVAAALDGKIIGWNPGAERLWGYREDEVLGRPVSLLRPADSAHEAGAIIARIESGERLDHYNAVMRRKDGSAVDVSISYSPIRGRTGQVTGVSAIVRDITEDRHAELALQASEQRLQQVLAAGTVVIYTMTVIGDTYTPSWVSDNIARITGFDVREALEPDWWFKHVHPDDWPRLLPQLPALYRDGQRTFEYRFQHKDGSYHWIHDEARLVEGAGGRHTEIFGAWVDVTERKAMEEAIRTARDVAERAAQARAAFLANMSHEIRTPMNAVLGLTELVLDTQLTPDQRRSLGLVQSAGETLLALINDILDMSKIEAEHLTLESISFDVRYLLESTASLLAVRVSDKPVELIVDVGADVQHMVSGDPTRLRQVLTNLVGNAIKFTHRGEVVLSARFEALPDHRTLVRFAVRDTGVGIAADKLETIFEEFSQADTSMTRQYGGTGLGLTIARRLVALMGGELTVTSEVGRGSEFAFAISLPTAEDAAMAIETVGTLTGQRVLVVDDNATNRRVIREMLRSEHTIVDDVSGGDAALEAIRRAQSQEKPYGLVIVDAQMPVRDGFELASVIRSDPTVLNTRLLMLTSAGQPGDGERCRKLGIEGYLMKPLSRSDLLTSAGALLGAPSRMPPGDLITRHSIAEGRRELKILLAEDNPVNQEVARIMLRKRGHQVDVVANGCDAVEAVRRARYDVVLMDIQMPKMDGFAATAAIRELPGGADLPIFALTAHTMSGERERCIARGMNGYLSKPFKGHELYALVEGVVPLVPGGGGPTPMPPRVPSAVPPALFDPGEFRRTMRDAGVEDAVDAVLDLFAEHAPARLAALNGAVASGEGDEIARAAHAFKSPAGAIGARGLESLLLDMELAGMAGAIDQARTAFDRVRPEVESVLQHLRLERGKGGR